jgi:hypothetical protein
VLTVGLGAFSLGGSGGYGDYGGAGFGSGKGGGGGAAGDGGNATVSTAGTKLSTTGYGAIGALAMSVGGSGGTGGTAGGVASRNGGSGGDGGSGAGASVDLTGGAVTTRGRNSDAVVALSVGGGGGAAGDVEGGGIGISISLGGQGGQGGSGGAASVSNGYWVQDSNNNWVIDPGAVISTTGSYARGIGVASIGGGGGRGGDAFGANLGLLSLSIGGNGGTGGPGGSASASNYGVVQTRGNNAVAIDAASVGGGGGTGGAAHSYDIGTIFTASAAVGGTGGGCRTVNGGTECPTGGSSTVLNYGQVLTLGSDAHGIRVQSIGGGGGAGGASVSETLTINQAEDVPSLSLNSSIGGKGGTGGAGGPVSALNAGLIITQGVGAAGMLTQSVGGGGGTGGDSSATSQSIGSTTVSINTTLGGTGGSGGVGGSVATYNSGFIWTLHDQAPGIVAQSVGGGGGNGGYGRASTGSRGGGSNGEGLSATLTIGGNGGTGGDGGSVNVYNYVSSTNTPDTGQGASAGIGAGGITTLGDASDGIYAHSIGGGGGNGGNATAAGGKGQIVVDVSVGGYGSAGGNGGSVNVDNGNGTILTYGANSNGIFAQSVGGGGGRGGTGGSSAHRDPQAGADTFLSQGLGLNGNVVQVADGVWQWRGPITNAFNQVSTLTQLASSYDTSNSNGYDPDSPNPSSTSMSVKIGAGYSGSGGAGGDGNTVTVNNGGTIQTMGPLAAGIFAQSVGGGGGVGGASNPAMDSVNLSQSSANASFSMGGRRGASGGGWLVTVTNTGPISTYGDASPGILAQSLGGGGGYGATTLMTSGTGNVASIVLGTDGSSGSSWNRGPLGLTGATVKVTTTNAITTSGDDSPGILAQSVGGGGGIVAVMSGVYDAATGKWTSATNNLLQTTSQQVFFEFTGNAPALSTAGIVEVNLQSNGTISTRGRNAHGVLAQSVGNGGGIIVSDYRVTTNNLVQTSGQGSGNNGYPVNVTSQSQTSITTSGDGAVGILAQSVSSGGLVNGMYGVQLNAVNHLNTAEAYGGTVTVNNSSDIHVSGAYAHGIFAESAALGGVVGQGTQDGFIMSAASAGSCGSNCANVGKVAVNLNAGTIYVSGPNSYGVAMVSQGNPAGTNATALTVNNGGRILATGDAAGAIFVGGQDANSVTVNAGGYVDATGSTAGVAIGTWSNGPATVTVNVDSQGTMKGAVNAPQNSTVSVAPGGLFEAGAQVNLGAAGVLSNLGAISVGAVGQLSTTAVTGTFVQGSTGRLVVDTDHSSGASDRIDVQGSVRLAGLVEVHPSVVANRAVTVLTATEGVSLDAGLISTRTHLFRFDAQSSGNSLQIQPQAEFTQAAASLGSNQQRVAAHLQELWSSGASLDAGFTALAGVRDAGSYARSLNTLSGQTVGAIAAFRFSSSRSFVSNMFSECPSYEGAGVTETEASCGWTRIFGSHADQAGTGGALGYQTSAWTFQAGGQKQIAPIWFLGGSIAYESSVFRGDAGSSKVSGDSLLLGATLRYQNGPWQVAGALDFGYGWYESQRAVQVGSFRATASAKPDAWHVGAHTRIAYTIPFEGKPEGSLAGWYLQPRLDLHLSHVRGGSYTESGADPFNLAVQVEGATTFTATPAMEVGTRIRLSEGAVLRPFASAGVELIANGDWAATARFAGQPASRGFRASTPIPDVLGKFTVGTDLLNTTNWDLRIQYTAEVGDGYTSHTGMGRLAYRF